MLVTRMMRIEVRIASCHFDVEMLVRIGLLSQVQIVIEKLVPLQDETRDPRKVGQGLGLGMIVQIVSRNLQRLSVSDRMRMGYFRTETLAVFSKPFLARMKLMSKPPLKSTPIPATNTPSLARDPAVNRYGSFRDTGCSRSNTPASFPSHIL